MNMNKRQTGFSFGGIVLLMIIGGLAVTVGLKLGPAYMENATIQSILDSLKEDIATTGPQSDGQIRSTLNKRLNVNGVKREGTDFEFTTNAANTVISIKYEVRQSLISNVDLIVSFSNSVELPNN